MSGRFLVFSLPRSGSNTLTRVLNCHPDIRCVHEPFSTTRWDRPIGPMVEDRKSLDARLERLWHDFNGIKHVYIPSGWPFPRRSELNRYLLFRSWNNVIFLHRRNLLQQIVSNEMAIQSRVFEATGEYRDKIQQFRFRPIEERKLGRRLKTWRRAVEQYRRDLIAIGTPFLDLTYEDVLGADMDLDARRSAIARLFEFLDRNPGATGVDREKIDGLLDPARSKINSADTYRRVPRIESVERRFGSDENGWLFR